ncbi:hypothetical protein TURU_031642 [Turdus rufiventris]|nr:hypothetical protein TURU_031642 [Turdus rufiventris]
MRKRERPGHCRKTGAAPVRQMEDKSSPHCRQKNGVTIPNTLKCYQTYYSLLLFEDRVEENALAPSWQRRESSATIAEKSSSPGMRAPGLEMPFPPYII